MQIKDLTQATTVASTDLFIKSNTDGGLTKLSFSDLKKNVLDGTEYTLLTSSDDMNTLYTPGKYFVKSSTPQNWPSLSDGYAFVFVENTQGSVMQTIEEPSKGLLLKREGSPDSNVTAISKQVWRSYQSGKVAVTHKDGDSTVAFNTMTVNHSTVEAWKSMLITTGNGIVVLTLKGTGAQPETTTLSGNLKLVSGSLTSDGLVTLQFNNAIYGSVTVIG